MREHNARMSLAWHIVALQRIKRLPKVDKFYLKEPKRKQPWQEQYALVQQWIKQAEKQAKFEDMIRGR